MEQGGAVNVGAVQGFTPGAAPGRKGMTIRKIVTGDPS